MWKYLKSIFDVDFMPHGSCYMWNREVIWLHVISDALIALAYYSIPFLLVWFVRKRRDLPYRWMFVMFGAFIVACGTTHLMGIVVVWKPMYWLDGFIKAFTAGISIVTAILLAPLLPQALALRSPVELENANKRLEAQIAERQAAEERFRAMLESAPDAMVIVNTEGRMVLVNTQTEKLFGYDRRELLGKTVETLIPQRFHAHHLHHREGFFSDPKMRPMGAGLDLWGLRKNGNEFPVEISLSPIKTREGTLVTAAIRDITERKLAEKELIRSNTELEQFAHVTSHDLQEPLRTMSNCAQLLARLYKGRLDPQADQLIGFLTEGSVRMQALIHDLLDFSRLGKEVRLEEVDSEKALNLSIANLEASIQEHHANITRDPLPMIMGDARQLTQLFQNLIGNAIKFHGAHPPRIHVSASKNDKKKEWTFSVQDHGIGIEPQFHKNIFVIFKRLHAREEYPGTGMGLAICKKIVESWGGRIWVESVFGKGSTFYFTIPNQKPIHEST